MAVTEYGLRRDGLPFGMKSVKPSTLILRFTCKRCEGVTIVTVEWNGGDERFNKTETCRCDQVLRMWERPSRNRKIFYNARIAVSGDFTINEKIEDGDIKWSGALYGKGVKFNTADGGSWTMEDGKFKDMVADKVNKVNEEMGTAEEEEEEEEDDEEKEIDWSPSSYDDDDSDDPDKQAVRDMRYNMEQEEEEEDLIAKKEEKKNIKKEKREMERKDKISCIMENKPCAYRLCLTVRDVALDKKN